MAVRLPQGLARAWVAAGALLAVASGVSVYDATTGKIRGDFTNFTLASARVMRDGGDPYDKAQVGRNYKYPPLNAVLVMPLTYLPVPLAQGLWTAINVGLLGWCFALHARELRPLRVPRWVWIVALVVTARFFAMNLRLGQWNTSVYCLAAAGALLGRRRPVLGGALAALAASLKYMPAFLLLFFAVKGLRRTALWMAAAMVLWLVVLPTAVLGPARHGELLRSYRAKAAATMADFHDDEDVVGHSFYIQLYARLTPVLLDDGKQKVTLAWTTMDAAVAKRLAQAAMAVLVLALAVVSARLPRPDRAAPGGYLMEVGLWFTLLLAISPEIREAHLLTLFTPALALAAWAARGELDVRERRVALGAVGLGFASIVAGAKIIPHAEYHRWWWVRGGPTWMIALLMGACLWLLLADARRRTAPQR